MVKKPIGYKLPDLSQSSFPEIPPDGYFDLVVIGSGPAGESAAVRAAQLGARVAIVEKKSTFGGPTGLTSKAVREAASRICKAVDQLGTVSGKRILTPSSHLSPSLLSSLLSTPPFYTQPNILNLTYLLIIPFTAGYCFRPG